MDGGGAPWTLKESNLSPDFSPLPYSTPSFSTAVTASLVRSMSWWQVAVAATSCSKP